jgi:hypothetical protein
MPKLQEKPSALKSEHPALQKMKILSFFLFFRVFFAPLDPDPDPKPWEQHENVAWNLGLVY